jgi:hypothetical protein
MIITKPQFQRNKVIAGRGRNFYSYFFGGAAKGFGLYMMSLGFDTGQ